MAHSSARVPPASAPAAAPAGSSKLAPAVELLDAPQSDAPRDVQWPLAVDGDGDVDVDVLPGMAHSGAVADDASLVQVEAPPLPPPAAPPPGSPSGGVAETAGVAELVE
eukprot:2648879-Pyramimonas_sp.AAC.1